MRDEDEEVLGSIRDQSSCRSGAKVLRRGSVVGSFIRGVCGIWVDGDNPAGIRAASRIKGEQRGSRPFGVILDAEAFAALVDPDKIAASVRSLVLDLANWRRASDHCASSVARSAKRRPSR